MVAYSGRKYSPINMLYEFITAGLNTTKIWITHRMNSETFSKILTLGSGGAKKKKGKKKKGKVRMNYHFMVFEFYPISLFNLFELFKNEILLQSCPNNVNIFHEIMKEIKIFNLLSASVRNTPGIRFRFLAVFFYMDDSHPIALSTWVCHKPFDLA